MKLKTLTAVAIAAAFAVPLAAQAADDKATSGSSAATPEKSGSAGSGASQKSSDGGAEAMFKALDKNNDGFLSKEEVKGTPHDKEFSKLDKNNDGKLSRAEHAAAPEHAAAKPSTGGASTPASGAAEGKSSKY